LNKETILHIVHASYPSQSGYVIRTENILNELSKRGVRIDVIGSIFSKRKEQFVEGRTFDHNGRTYYQILSKPSMSMLAFIYKLPLIRIIFRYIEILINSFLIIFRVDIKKYDIIHGHSTYLNGVSAYIIAKLYRKPFVYDIHALGIDALNQNSWGYKIGFYFEKILIQNAEAIIAIDRHLEKSISKRFNVKPESIFVAPNGIDSGHFSKSKNLTIKNKINGLPKDKILLGIDNSKPVEGFKLVYNNIEQISKQLPDVHFIVFGDKGKEKRSPLMTYLPKVAMSEIPQYFSMVSLFIMPRLKNKQSDTITPLKILELMSCEVPLLVSNVGGLTHCIQDEVTGFILTELTPDALIKSIKVAIKYKNLPLIIKNAKKWVIDNKTWTSAVDKYCKCYKYVNTLAK
jgi:glycosyltransferase involved in cell wall biosynthesis